MEQERQDDDAQGEPTTPTPSTRTTTTIREGGQRRADASDLDSPGNKSRGQAPGAHTPSPTHTVYSAHRGTTTQWHTGHYPSTTDTTGPQGGRATGERTTRRQLVDPEPDHTTSQRTDYSARATDRTASTTSRQDRTEYSTQNTDYSHIPRRDTNHHDSPSYRSRGRAPDAYTRAPPTRCTAHSGKNLDQPTQRPNGTPTTAPGRPTQPGPRGRGQPEGRAHSDGLDLKRYQEPMAHGREACEPSHLLWPMARRPVSRHTRAEAVDTGCQRDIPVL